MKRLPIILLLVTTSAFAQHKISMQKYEVPKYPPIARQAQIEGEVKLKFDVLPSGEVQNVQVISGHPMLVPGSVEAIKKFRFHCDDCKWQETAGATFVIAFKHFDPNNRNAELEKDCCTDTEDKGLRERREAYFKQSANIVNGHTMEVTGAPFCVCIDVNYVLARKVRAGKCLYLWHCALQSRD